MKKYELVKEDIITFAERKVRCKAIKPLYVIEEFKRR